MKAGILSIGTEITSGEIVNANAAWIAQRLEACGYRVAEHLSVPDEPAAIVSALMRLHSTRVLIVTGGLGPTSDDVTRASLAKWMAKPLQFSESVWRELAGFYKKRGLPMRQAHRHQCFFPKGVTILKNPVGTAHGFMLKKNKCSVYVLPGPPRELEGMWQSCVEPTLEPGGERHWSYWTCLGMPESEVAEKVEPLIAGLDLDVGYRATVPYVHLKLRGGKLSTKLVSAIEQALGAAVVAKENHDFAEDFLISLKGHEVLLQDQVSRGFLSARLSALLRQMPDLRLRIEDCWNSQPSVSPSKGICGQLLQTSDDPFGFDVVWRDKTDMQKIHVQLPFKLPVASERGAKSAAEQALFKWWSWAKASV